ncbi:MAG TPA: cysteine--tRNA ligase [Povalibacter sp.]|uniref:cysteine--tRNA ligase n=1 Tax=Povalibacter sp. TaxID=1962978 RepID=UPI002CE5C1BD|nr:cysteine--tRNA ligase [Povalibacter sp.]HMN45660.1 cysteine--tRNA ligase [Povalibacter sp.]
MLQLFNTLTGRKEEFHPLEPGIVRMYVCGDTVYDYCHIGHARSKIAFDIVRRYLAFSGYRVTFVRNITDIDDKIIKRAAENRESVQTLTQRFIDAMHEDYDRLGILRPDFEPKATGHIPSIIAMTRTLIDKNYAYVATNGDVMYSVSAFAEYGQLSGRQLGDLRAGARVAIDEAKRDPLDFVLWKQAKPGEPSWPSPWGEGRPGWHIECSAMTLDLLGTRFDIHGGGLDLKFPHHENEIAQSCAATGDRFATYWMHNGFVNVDNEKMAKSVGNFFLIRDVLNSGRVRDPEVLRFFLLSSHYRGPINYSLTQIEQADAALSRLYTALRDIEPAANHEPGDATRRFKAAMDDDFNTPDAVAALQTLAGEINRARANAPQVAATLAAELRHLGSVLGVLQSSPDAFLRKSASAGSEAPGGDAAIEQLIAARQAARKARNFKESDRIRDELAAAGVVLEDKPDGSTTWRRA